MTDVLPRQTASEIDLKCAEHPDRDAMAEVALTGLGMCGECYRDHMQSQEEDWCSDCQRLERRCICGLDDDYGDES